MGLPRLLITGSRGRIGRILVQQLAGSFEIYGADLAVADPATRTFQANVADYEAIAQVVQAIAPLSYVVHLAGDPRVEADWSSVRDNNIVGTRNVYEAAKSGGVRRVVFASSNHVTGGYEGIPPTLHTVPNPRTITTLDPIRPDSFYGTSKAFGEAIARQYYELHGIESVCLRIGSVLADDDPTKDDRHRSTWLSHRDLVQLVKKSLLANVKFGIYYGISNNGKRFWDISNARQELDYQPEDDASTR